ncbi:MAG: phage portal protein [Armatimonadota bacterium]|nr:phage portal protein [bacterium]
MNFADRIVTYINPEAGMRRLAARKTMQVLNTGYSEGGAATNKNWARGWRWRGGSVKEDQEMSLSILRQRSRDLFMNSPIACAAINRRVVNVIGPGLRMRSTPDAEVLGLNPDEATAWARIREREFLLWAKSRECEVSGLDNYDETQQLAYLSWILNGDAIALLTMADPVDQPYELRIQLIEADRVCNPPGHERDPLFHDGVEVDQDGRVVAYHIRSNHPLAQTGGGNTSWARIPVRGEKSGRLNVLHLIARQRTGQYRGIPILAPVVASCKQLTRYSEAELTAAVISAFITVLIKSKTPDTAIGESFAPGMVTPSTNPADNSANPNEPFELPMGSASMVALNADEEAEMVNPNRPNAQFGAFMESVCKEIGAATDIPVELLTLKFTSTYTAARAALLEFWKRARMDRSAFNGDFNDPIAQEILEEGILKDRIQAPRYFDDWAIRDAWLASQWNGQAMGQMNPTDEVRAAKLRVDGGFSTHAKESIEISGIDFDDVIQEQTVERQRLKDAGIVVEKTSAKNK